MSTAGPENPSGLDSQTRVIQIIIGALATGLLMFAIFALFVRRDGPPAADGPGVLTFTAVIFALMSLVMQATVPRWMAIQAVRAIRKQVANPGGDRPSADELTAQLLGAFQVKTIVGCALAEGAGFFALISYFIEGSAWSLVAAGLMLVMILSRFPTRASVHNWCVAQL